MKCSLSLKLEECVTDHPRLIVCRLGPYSPMLNNVQTIWSKMKAVVKQQMRVLEVQPLGVGEQRLAYVEGLRIKKNHACAIRRTFKLLKV